MIVLNKSENTEAQEKAARLASIVQSSDDAIITKRLDGIVTSWNAGAQRIFGYTEEEMIGQSISKLFPPERLNEESMIIGRLKKGEKIDHFETQRVTKDGKLLDISLTISLIRDLQGNAIEASKIARDITAQKRAERLIAENEERLKIILSASGLGTWELNLTTKEFTYSKRYQEILGYGDTTGPLEYNDFLKRLHPEDVNTREKAFEEAFQHGSLQFIARLIMDDASITWVEVKGKVFYDSREQPARLVGTLRDITTERTYQGKLKESEKKFRLLADFMPQLIWTSDANGNLNYFSKAIYDYTGLSEKEMRGQGWMQMVHPEDRQNTEQQWQKAIETGEDFSCEHRFLRHDGEYQWQLSRALAQRDNQGNITRWVGTSTNIHEHKAQAEDLEKRVEERTQELKQANHELARSNTELASFSYVASHDLQEPLRKIQTFSGRILETETGKLSEAGQDYFKRMQRASHRMQNLINDLLAYSRLNTQDREFQDTDLNFLLEDVKNELKEALDEKKGEIRSQELPTIKAIPFQLRQLFTNLIGNSIKFSREGIPPHITLMVDKMKGRDILEFQAIPNKTYFKFTLMDNGIGFDQKYNQLIFQVFQRLHGRSEYAGTGIGLAICKKIVENHQGCISAVGESNTGTAITIYLPQGVINPQAV